MKILYGIQGTGHGHISRAKELLPELRKHAPVDVLVSGYACQLDLDDPVTYRKYGISLSYDSNGGVSVLDTLKDLRPVRFINDVQSVPLEKYDLVVSDYEPVSAWAAKIAEVPSVALSHQAAFISERTPRPERRSVLAEAILQHFSPAEFAIGFHFKRYDTFVEPPIIRSEIRDLNPVAENHITVYLPAYHHAKLTRIFSPFTGVDWHIFAPTCETYEQKDHISIHPVSNIEFLNSFEACKGVITSAGFETSAEAMYLKKKLLVLPIRNQYEQLCNAAALQEMGVKALTSLENFEKEIGEWLELNSIVTIDEVADPGQVVDKILRKDYIIKEETAVPETADIALADV